MKKNSLKYILILILVATVIMGNSGVVSKDILYSIREETFPATVANASNNKDIMKEIIPSYDINENILLSEDTSLYESAVVMSTLTDSRVDISIDNYSDEVKQECTTVDNNKSAVSDIDDGEVVEAAIINSNESFVDNGINYSIEQLSDFEFLIGNCYTIDGSTSINSSDINIEVMLNEDLSIDISGDEYKVLIYHTHGSETFIDSRPGVTEDTIIGVGDELTRILEEDYGIKTYHDRTVYDVVNGKLDRNNAYTQSGNGIDYILSQYPSIEVVLDIHRDGVRDEVHLMKVIDGKPTAQIMFFNGVSRLNEEGDLGYLHNSNLSSNLSFSLQMHLKGKTMYGDLMRKIYIGGYCYNLDRKARASLIEVGAQNNTLEEAKNAMTPLASILYSVLSGN